MTCRSKLAIMSVQVPLSFEACNTSHAVQETPIRLIILLINVILCLPLARFPAIVPVIAKYSIFSFLLTWLKNLICLTVIIFTSSLLVSGSLIFWTISTLVLPAPSVSFSCEWGLSYKVDQGRSLKLNEHYCCRWLS